MRRRLPAAVAMLVLSAGLAGTHPAASTQRGDPVKERERVRAEQALVASKLDVDKASLAKISSALQALSADLSTQQALLAQADDELADARQRLRFATDSVTRTEGRIVTLKRQMRQRAIAAYLDPPADQALATLDLSSMPDETYRRMYGEALIGNDADVADQLKSARADLDFAREASAAARTVAQDKRSAQQARLDKVSAARRREQTFASSVQHRIDKSLASAIRLSRKNKALSVRIARQQALLLARLAEARERARLAEIARVQQEKALAAERSRAAAAAFAEGQAAARAAAQAALDAAARQNTIRANGSESRALPAAAASVSGPGGIVAASSDGLQLATVGGITVAAQIAGQLQSLLSAAAADGLHLGGGGYRSGASQIALRRAHCGSSYYAVYQMSAGACHPPTAPPGQSMHEVGLAIDFTNCSSRSSACYQWLAGNASRFGFFNLPSEPWHWSINGH